MANGTVKLLRVSGEEPLDERISTSRKEVGVLRQHYGRTLSPSKFQKPGNERLDSQQLSSDDGEYETGCRCARGLPRTFGFASVT